METGRTVKRVEDLFARVVSLGKTKSTLLNRSKGQNTEQYKSTVIYIFLKRRSNPKLVYS